ncbi:hypothetical protein L3Q82_017206 [Scortum barcoo]|uniref:Uncharacterized protein n=1 Tax=Scortum barcoo TaxID=214431 RepID=A0ACB8VL52_9TELE|nr:hypothetical protein L3Q82_017206 [Scortum barcoo]
MGSHRSPRYVSWCEDSADTPGSAAVMATDVSHQNHQPAGSGSVPPLLLSPPESSGGETTFSHRRPQPTFTKRTHDEAFTHSHLSHLKPPSHTDRAPSVHADEGEDDEGRKGSKQDSSLLHPDEGNFLLPRSSPVISRRHRPVSWHGGGANTSAPSSLCSVSPASGSLSLDHLGRPTLSSLEDLGSKPSSSRKPRYISSNLNRLLSAGFHLPFGGQQGLAEEHRGRGLTTCDAPHTAGISTSTQHNKDRRSSEVPELPADIFKTCCELENENAHFIVVDMVLEVLEGVKWTLRFDRLTDTHQHTHCCTCTHSHTGHTPTENDAHSDEDERTSHGNTHYSHEHTHQHTLDEEEEEAEHQPKTFSVLSTDSGFEDCGVDAAVTQRDSLINFHQQVSVGSVEMLWGSLYFVTPESVCGFPSCSAEWLAQQLVLEFRRNWLPSHGPRRGRQSLRSSLQELPGTESVAVSSGSLAEEIKLRTRMRGSLSWAPPRLQIIFTVQPHHRLSEVVALQHFLCAGCGTKVEPRYIKKLRYCEYLGRYFCDCCHSGSESVIPGRILSCWDFSRFPVSDFSKQLLDSVWSQPLFDLTCVGKTLYSKVKELDKFRELQDQLLGIKKLLRACRLSGSVMTEFDQLPAHLMEQPHLFSMDDLLRVKKGQLVTQARAVLHSAIDHVENCELCLARGFICEFCREKDVIFPFQIDICRRCPACRACFHKHCFVEKKCPKCARIQSRKKRLEGSMKCDT